MFHFLHVGISFPSVELTYALSYYIIFYPIGEENIHVNLP